MAGHLRGLAVQARQAAQRLAISSGVQRNAALASMVRGLEENREKILEANARDLAAAQAMVQRGELARPLLDRLNLAGGKFAAMVRMVRSVAAQADPLGRTQSAMELDQGLILYRVSVPIGVLGVIFESRPDALVQIASLCLKAGNAVLLKGGREAAHTNQALAETLIRATEKVEGIPRAWLGLLESREEVRALLELDGLVDLLIPRGSKEFVRHIMEHTRIPVLGHADGICHVYVDRQADLDKAVRIAVDSKTQYVAVCNAAETLLVHQDIAGPFLQKAVPELLSRNVELRGDERVRALVKAPIKAATEEDWRTEYLDYILSIRVVDSLEEAIAHVNHYGSHHTDAIVTQDPQAATRFLRSVDAASVMHNASTRFADGFKYGLGAEVGISTSRLHSRGPVGLEGLTIYKYILEGDGHVVEAYDGPEGRPFTHRRLEKDWCPPRPAKEENP